jgi:hypothetical protein
MKGVVFIYFFLLPFTVVGQLKINNSEVFKKTLFTVRKENGNSTGVAFICGRKKSTIYLITARHVIEGASGITLTGLEGETYQAELVRVHPVYDLALLKTSIPNLPIEPLDVISDISMNDEVGFISTNKGGNVLPSKGNGLVRDVTGESLVVLMSDVEGGDSGSPLFCQGGIAGIILQNGRFINCLNIVLVHEILKDWADSSFEVLFKEIKFKRAEKREVTSLIGAAEKMIAYTKLGTLGKCKDELQNLGDHDLTTGWKCTGNYNEEIKIWFFFSNDDSFSKVKIFFPDDSTGDLPSGKIMFIHDGQTTSLNLTKFLSHRERLGTGYWYVYEFKKHLPATEIGLTLKFRTDHSTFAFNEIQFIGVSY